MEKEEFKRYDRQVILEEIGFEGQQKLKAAKVLVIGAGGLGCPLLLYLAAAGVGKIGVTDHDLVDESNLQRQVIFHTGDLGKNKAEVAAAKLSLLNPYVYLQPYPEKLSLKNATALIGQYDLVIDGSDNFPTRYLVNDTCVRLNKTLIFGSIYKFEGQVSIFNFQGGPDYRSFFPEPPLAEEVPNCGESGVVGPLAGIIGSMMANEAIKVICGFGDVLSGKLLIFNAINNDLQIFNMGTNQSSQSLEHQANPEVVHTPTPNTNSMGKGADENHDNTPPKTKAPAYQIITSTELDQWKTQGETFCLVDLREAYEFDENNGVGMNIPLYELKERMDEIPSDRKVVLSCTSGSRSRIAAKIIGAKKHEIFIIS